MSALTREQLALRVAMLVAPWVFFLSIYLEGGSLPAWAILMTMAFAVTAVVVPDSRAGVGVLGSLGFCWVAFVGQTDSPVLLLAAASLVVFHCATLVAAQGPLRTTTQPALLRRWAIRAGATWCVAAAVCALDWLLRDAATTELPFAAALALLIGLAVVLARWLSTSRGRA